MFFVSFVVRSCREPEPGAIWLRRINHEEHEGTRRWRGSLFVFFVSFVVKIGFEPEPGGILRMWAPKWVSTCVPKCVPICVQRGPPSQAATGPSCYACRMKVRMTSSKRSGCRW